MHIGDFMKKWILLSLTIALVVGFFIGINLYKVEENEESVKNEKYINETNNNDLKNTITTEIETSGGEEKISVKTEVIEEVYYVSCDHLIKTRKNDTRSLVNMNEEELADKYSDWQIKEFNSDKVILFKEEPNFCNQHYILKDVDGFVTIYNMDNLGKINERIKITEIETKYLPEKDRKDLVEGIKVYTIQNLNKLIEDFE